MTAKRIIYDNNPILKWCMANVAVDIDRNDNIQPMKTSNPRKRIDGFASLLDAYAVYEQNKEDYMNLI
jgi:phage terminase large subunit-like protein